jgi:5-methylcytosine-specific restriction endonuclease McrA
MGMRPLKMCAKCHATVEHGARYCSKHAKAVGNRPRNALRKLYCCHLWRVTVRNIVLSRDPQCQFVENGIACPRLSTDVDHIVEAEQWVAMGNSFYDEANLRGLCHAHHSRRTALDQGFASG